MTKFDLEQIINATKETVLLVLVTALFLLVFGLLIGYFLYFTSSYYKEKQHKVVRVLHVLLSTLIDIFRSIPFVIVVVLIIPLTIILTGTMLGAKAALPALIISGAPFYARVVYNAFKDIPRGNFEALEAMGANIFTKIIYLTKEALPSLVSGLTVALVSLVGFIASAGAIGGGGLGDLAIKRAFAQSYTVMYASIAILLALVLLIQVSGEFISKKIDKR